MATTIVTKNSSTASAVPTAAQLVQGELAVNVADKRLYTEDNAGAVVELGTNPSTLTVTGEITANGGIALGDNDKATFGASDDLQIYHDGSNSYIKDLGTGSLVIDGTNITIRDETTGKTAIDVLNNTNAPLVNLRYDNSTKLATTATGIDVTGTVTADGLTVDGNGDVALAWASGSTHKVGSSFSTTYYTGMRVSADSRNTDIISLDASGLGNVNIFTGTAETKRVSVNPSGDISFYEDTGTTPKFFWDASAESLGIGTSSPTSKIHVARTDAAGAYAYFGASSDGGARGLQFTSSDSGVYLGAIHTIDATSGSGQLAFATGGSERMRIDSVGTTTIKTDGTTQLVLNRADASIQSGNQVAQLLVTGDDPSAGQSGAAISFIAGDAWATNSYPTNITFSNDLSGTLTERLRIDSSGNVGIQSTDPTNNSVGGVGGLVIGNGTGNKGLTLFGSSTAQQNIAFTDTSNSQQGLIQYDHGGDYMRLFTSATERLRIDSSGNVGIGTSSPLSKLNAKGTQGNWRVDPDSVSGEIQVFSTTTANDGFRDFRIRTQQTIFDTAGTERMRIDSSGNLYCSGGSGGTVLTLTASSGTTSGDIGRIRFGNNNIDSNLVNIVGYQDGATNSGGLKFETQPTGGATVERMRIDSSGNLLVGTTDTFPGGGDTNTGVSLTSTGAVVASRDGDFAARFNRKTSDGDIVQFNKDGTTVGSIGAFTAGTSAVFFGSLDTALLANSGNDCIHPWNASTNSNRDNVIDFGNASNRWNDIYATNGTIQTSDFNEKQDIAELSDAEQRVAVAAKGLLRKFRWKDSVAEKGDEARIHFGIIAQDLQAAFEAEGLDAGDYAMFISTTWTDEETNEEKTRMGVRYSELLAFIIAAL